ncbi:Asp-tRNA(Asn)/Glu-tRNA(Gln) amidotransferase A subunit family amidase [Bradyrhizobium sp. JR3.5]
MTWFCWIGNLAGLPCISIPCGSSSEGLPVGMMLMGQYGQDERLLAVAQWMDRRINMDA